MTTELQGQVVAMASQTVPSSALWKMLSDKITEILGALMVSTNPRHLRRLISTTLPDYVAVKAIAGSILSGEAINQQLTSRDLVLEINKAAFENFEHGVDQFLSRRDRNTVLAVLREQANFFYLFQEAPQSNKPALYKALIEGFWARQKLDMAISTVLLIVSNSLEAENRETPHWLCLAAKQYLSEWESILFSNNPVFRDRLTRKIEELNIVSLEEWEKELGL